MIKTYSAICADPPWRFKNFSQRGESRNAIAHYDCMTIDEICALPVGDFAREDCALFLWATDPLLPVALKVIERWGFEYKTVAFYWAKTNTQANLANLSERDFFCGLGYWTRANVEQCLLATRGKPKRLAKNIRRLIIDRRREHSRKPDEAFDRIRKLTNGPYLELFARESREGWDSWGNQKGLFNLGSVPTRRLPSSLSKTAIQQSLFDRAPKKAS